MAEDNVLDFISDIVDNIPDDWIRLTTHRLDIYDESKAKSQFIEQFEDLYLKGQSDANTLATLPTAYDYIRLGHPLSSVLEWTVAKLNNIDPSHVISFDSNTIPIMAVLRKNYFEKKSTRIVCLSELPTSFNAETLSDVYGYEFEIVRAASFDNLPAYNGTTIVYNKIEKPGSIDWQAQADFYVLSVQNIGSILLASTKNSTYLSEIQHVRRRESIAMTPSNCVTALQLCIGKTISSLPIETSEQGIKVVKNINNITGTTSDALVGSSGLSVQYSIVMGLIHHARDNYKGKNIRIAIPPNCYGGTNDQARRVAACLEDVDIVDLPVDGNHNMVDSIERVLNQLASEDAVPFIIAEIPTNPRVEVPDLEKLRDVLSTPRMTPSGDAAINPVFILDQTFCPNVPFLGEGKILSDIRTISYVSGSKFPSGGLCTAGYCVSNKKAENLIPYIQKHMTLCENNATDLQIELLAQQLPSMLDRIEDAYENTHEFVQFIREALPTAKINFVSDELAERGFTPSVFSLDLPTKGATEDEREAYKRALNLKLINRMITQIPHEAKFCVSYGQLKGSYWTIPATSTQGTTQEGDKDYIVRVALSPNLDLNRHKQVFEEFISEM